MTIMAKWIVVLATPAVEAMHDMPRMAREPFLNGVVQKLYADP